MTTTTTTMLQLREWKKKEERLKRKTEFVLVQKNASLHIPIVLHMQPTHDNTQKRIKSQWSGETTQEEWNARSSITHLQTQDSSSLHSGKSFTSTIFLYVTTHILHTLCMVDREKMCVFVCGRVENLFLLFTLLSF